MKFKKRSLILSILVLSIFLLQSTALASARRIPPGGDPPPTTTTYRIYGYVKKAGTNTPISGATVKLYRGTSTYMGRTTTDSNGYYSFSYRTTLTITRCKSVASRSGYYTSSRTSYMLENRVRLDHYLTPLPPPPTAPTISNVEITQGEPREVTVSWDVAWGTGASQYYVECYWGTDTNLGIGERIYNHVSSTATPSFSCQIPPERIPYSGGTYYYKIYAKNTNSVGYSDDTYGPSSIIIDGVWKLSPTDDAFTYAETPYTNYDSNPTWYNKIMVATGDPESPGLFYGWFKFDIQYPELVKSAVLRLYNYGNEPYGHGTISAYQCGTNWEEDTITYDNSYNSISIGPLLATDTSGSAGTWDAWNVILAASEENTFAIYLETSGGQLRGAHYYSREHSTSSLRPYLEIEYIDSVFKDDCSNIGSWSSDSTYTDFPYSPLAYTDLSDDYVLMSSNGQYYLSENGGGSGSTRGTAYHRPLTQEIPLDDLDSFEISLNYNYQSDFRQGSIIVALYDSDYISNYIGVMTKPMVVTELFVETEYGGSPKMSVNAYYVDTNLNEHSECLASHISQSWSGTVTFWYDSDGLWVRLSSGNPVLLAGWKEANMRREAAHVVIQGIGMGSPIPILSIDNIEVLTKSAFSQFVDLQTANELRSGPKDIGLTRPGPTNELQFFPLNGDSLKFKLDRTAAFYDILLDLRAVPNTSPAPSNPIIEIKVNDEVVDSYQVTVDPVQQLPTANYLHESRWTSTAIGYVTIELTVSGWSSYDGVIALRGIWVMIDYGASGRFLQDLEQVFPSSGELVYYVPMGPATNLDLEWEGDDGIEVSVDGHVITWTNLRTINIDLGSYSKGTLHELKLRHTGVLHIQAGITVMHSIYTWLTIEIDYIDFPSTYLSYSGFTLNFPGSGATVGYSDFEVYLTDIWNRISDWYGNHTHGRVNFFVDDAIPYADVQTIETGTGWTESATTQFGDTWYSHKGSRDYAWAFYADNLVGNGGLYIKSTAGVSTNNWRDRWVGLIVQWHHYPSATAHELGHLVHIHEGYDSATGGTLQGQPCEHDLCPMHSCSFDWEYCQFHWFQTWLNTRNQTTGLPSHPPCWYWDWWLV